MKCDNNRYIYADKIFVNGIINSIDSKNNIYEAMAIKDGKVLSLGSNKEMNNYRANKTEIIDLKYKTVLPGFIDVHCHLAETNMMKLDQLSLFNGNNPVEYLKLIQSYVDSHQEQEIIYGVGWKSSSFKGEKADSSECIEVFKGPNKNWLKSIRTNKPIILKNYNNTALWLNEEAFNYFKISKYTKVPIGGKIELDEYGELWGILKENAMRLIDFNSIEYFRENEYRNRFIKYQHNLHSHGITTICIVDEEESEKTLKIYRNLEIRKKLKLRINYATTILPKEICKKSIFEQLHQLKRNRIMYNTDLFDISIAKFSADGNIEMKTAYLFKPYAQINKKLNETNGVIMWNIEELKEAIKMANRLDFNVYIHAAGDLACKVAIDAIEYSIQNNVKQGYRNSLIDIDLITKYYIRRMKLLKINAIIKPLWFYKNINAAKYEILAIGEERAQREYPVKTLIDEGLHMAGSVNHEIKNEQNPLNAIECAVIRNLYDFIPSKYPQIVDMNDDKYRLNPRERISIMEGIKAFTINAAYILGRENEIGSLEIGKKSDLIVLDKNIFDTEPLDLHDINIERTYLNGELVYLNE